jgi:21S rRNA (GM2251-2'-O)-methyltransferase
VNKQDITEDTRTRKDKSFGGVINGIDRSRTSSRQSNYPSLDERGGRHRRSSSLEGSKDETETLASLGPNSATRTGTASWTGKGYTTQNKRTADHDNIPLYQRRLRFQSDHQGNEPPTDNHHDSSYDKWLTKSSGFQVHRRPQERAASENTANGSSRTMQEKEGPVSSFDRRVPLSIPYTTPASEFLYGTSPILSALQSTRYPRRKLYKLYVHSTPQREAPSQDQNLIRLAKRAGVAIENVTGDGIRLLDKMSGGRPHNGYILEASPLPKMPVLSLGQVSNRGFDIVLGHQSREDALVNGTETFVPIPRQTQHKHMRQPLVLYLDSITDPGNLGGIIRTASFLGVTAVAISTRNSAPFSPVVLKASAGAAENITIFSVDKPAGFIVDSKAAGWKVYAAVAPEKGVDRPSISVEKLDDPLSDSPIILMLGSEGEGLRWNLRSKADVDLYIRGANGRGSVDSLNVSVAAGVLCNALLRASKKSKSRSTVQNSKATNAAEDITEEG